MTENNFGVKISDAELKEFKELYKKEFNEELSDEGVLNGDFLE